MQCLLNCSVHFLIRLAFSCVSLHRHRQSWRRTLAAVVVIDVKLVFKLAVGCGAVPTNSYIVRLSRGEGEGEGVNNVLYWL